LFRVGWGGACPIAKLHLKRFAADGVERMGEHRISHPIRCEIGGILRNGQMLGPINFHFHGPLKV
jgi:hypothetical protein